MASASPNSREASSMAEDSKEDSRDSYRDRITAMLEADSDDDDGEDLAEASPSKIASFFSSSPHEGENAAQQSKNYDLDLEDEDAVVPQLSRSPNVPAATATQEEDDGAAAYARLKNLFTKPTKEQPAKPESTANNATAAEQAESDESDDEMPVRKANATRRRPAASTPSPRSSPRRATRSPSAGLFVSPAKTDASSPSRSPARDNASDSDEMPSTLALNGRFKALVAKKRAEREAKEKVQQEKASEANNRKSTKQKKIAKQLEEIYSSEMNDGMTEEAQQTLTENSRRTQRKASKKALEEMNRETQRMARNQQLTHQARVKKKVTTKDFLKSFGYKGDAGSGSDDDARPAGALVSSDNEGRPKATPPSSPPSLGDNGEKRGEFVLPIEDEDEYIIRTGIDAEHDAEELPDLKSLLSSQPAARTDKGKARVGSPVPPPKAAPKVGRKSVRIVMPAQISNDSDDDLEIESAKKSRFAVFDRLPEKKASEPASLLDLRALAHLRSPPSKGQRKSKPSITQAEMMARIAKEMQKQTMAEKQERLEMLRAKGIVFRTDEEVEEDQLHIENMLEKARKEAMELGRKEKDDAEKNGEEIDETYQLPSDDESERSYNEDEEEEEEADVELSGSEDEDAGAKGEDGDVVEKSGLVDDAAEEGDSEEEQGEDDADEADQDVAMAFDHGEEDDLPAAVKRISKPRARNVIEDDEDEEDEVAPTPTQIAPTQSQSSPFNAFGFAVPKSSMNFTQMFQGTMADLATQKDVTQPAEGESLDFLRDAPVPTMPDMSPMNPISQFQVQDSQSVLETPAKPKGMTQATPRFTPATITSQVSPTKFSEVPDPTQDAGFEPLRASMVPVLHSTVDTVILPENESPIKQKKGKLRKRAQAVAELSDDEGAEPGSDAGEAEDDFELTKDAFDTLFKAAKKKAAPVEKFDKKKSEAAKYAEDQAEESEDEYAGLGGASDDDSDEEIDEEVQAMLDEGPVNVKQAEIAKLFADRDRAENEKGTEKLYKDLMTGALRKRKRNDGFDDLSDDSEDERAEIRRQKQRDFARRTKALLGENENYHKIAENPKKSAFWKSLEDRDEEEAIDYLGDLIEDVNPVPASQADGTQEQADQDGDAAPVEEVQASETGTKRKLPAGFATGPATEGGMSHRRRPAEENTIRRPQTLADIKESLSFLIDDGIQVPNSQVSDASEDEDEDDEDPISSKRPRRNDTNGSAVLTTVRASVINRLTVSRQNSLATETDESQPSGPMAFHITASNSGVFKVPALLRRATTNLSTASNESSQTSTPTNENAPSVRMGGSKKSNIHFQAREAERMKKVRDAERRRGEGIRKKVVGKGRSSVLGRSLGGKSGFE